MIYVLTGKKHSGKTSFLKDIIKKRKKHGERFYGVLSEAVFEGRRRTGYDAVCVETGERFCLSRRDSTQTHSRSAQNAHSGSVFGKSQKAKQYYLDPKGINRISKIITSRKSKSYTLIIDEIGELEMKHKKGLWPALQKALKAVKGDTIIVAQKTIANDLIDKLMIYMYNITPIKWKTWK